MTTADRIVSAFLRGLLVAVAIGPIGCGGGGNPPHPPTSPTPSPTIAPTPPPPAPITIQGRTFIQSGKPFVMKSIVPCCAGADAWGWPGGNSAFIKEAKRLGANMVEIRLGPYGARGETRLDDVVAYLPASVEKVDLTKWNEKYWAKRHAFIDEARSYGITVVVDALDGWRARTENWDAFNGGNNIQGYDNTGCQVTRKPLDAQQTKWVTKVAQEMARHDNVMFHISNEVMLCNPERVWIEGIAKILKQHAPGKLIGDNSQEDWSCDVAGPLSYASFHSSSPASVRRCPAVVNETKDTILTGFCQNWLQANADGTYFMFWRGNRTLAQVEAELLCWQKPTPPPGEGDEIAWSGENGDLPYLKTCKGNPGDKTIMPEPTGIKCVCTKKQGSGPCPPGAKEDATSKAAAAWFKSQRATYQGLSGDTINNSPAYMVSILKAAAKGGYCAKFSGFDEVWVKKPGADASYGFDVIHHPATGGALYRDAHYAVVCRPGGL